MLNGVLQEKIAGSQWNMQSFDSTLNHRIEFSANVNPDGVVTLKALVMEAGAAASIDKNRSEKLTRYYENRIKEVLRKWTAMSKGSLKNNFSSSRISEGRTTLFRESTHARG
jgi:hypothetical protein